MPSKSYQKFFNYNLKDIQRLVENYNTLKGDGRGKKALDHITRSGILLLVAAWEVYIEEVLCESVDFISTKLRNPDNLPTDVKKTLSKFVAAHKHELKPFELAGQGWKKVYRDEIFRETEKLNTPKKANIDDLFLRYLGIDSISSNWTLGDIDFIVSTRGSIAHRMKSDKYIKMIILKGFMEEIRQYVSETDKYLYAYLTGIVGKTPWNNTY